MLTLHQQASQAITEKLDTLARSAVDRQYTRQAEHWKPYNQAGYAKSIRDAGYHFSYLAESLAADDTSLFLDYAAWVKVLFAGLNFPPAALTVNLECMDQALAETLAPDLAVLAHSYIDAALEHLHHTTETLQSFMTPEAPLYELARQYLNALLQSDRRSSGRLILDAVAQGTGVKDIYLHVFQPCQLEIGRLWQMNRASVAQEHFCSVTTQMIMSQLYPYIFSTPKTGYRLVATSVSGELHEIGVRMVSDFLEMEGWDTCYLGANTPTDSILHTIEQRQANIIAISATMSFHVSKVAQMIASIHASSSLPPVKILVGGYPFNISSGLWQRVGADGYARNAQEAVAIAQNLMEAVR
jgi:MerR family transcriptional regulator, light-induced transcriptional regulator